MRHLTTLTFGAVFAMLCVAAVPAGASAQDEPRRALGDNDVKFSPTRPETASVDKVADLLDRLFADLHETEDTAEAKTIQDEIWQTWATNTTPAIELLLTQSIQAMDEEALDIAETKLDAVTQFAPDYAAGWHQRAELRREAENYAGAVADLQKALAAEPRHFGALILLGQIFETLGNPKGALRAYEAAIEHNPHLDRLRQQVDRLRFEVQGTDI